jgi:lysophospholipase L1-like esterase
MPRVRRSKYANDAKDTAQLASSLAQRATKTEVTNNLLQKRDKTEKLVMEDMSAEVVSAMTGGTTVNLNSIPQDNTVDSKKTIYKSLNVDRLSELSFGFTGIEVYEKSSVAANPLYFNLVFDTNGLDVVNGAIVNFELDFITEDTNIATIYSKCAQNNDPTGGAIFGGVFDNDLYGNMSIIQEGINKFKCTFAAPYDSAYRYVKALFCVTLTDLTKFATFYVANQLCTVGDIPLTYIDNGFFQQDDLSTAQTIEKSFDWQIANQKAINEIKQTLDVVANGRWQGKKANFLGDSITQGLYYNGSEFVTAHTPYHQHLKTILGLAEARNYGVSGTHISGAYTSDGSSSQPQNFVSRYSTMDNDADLIVVFGGTNDFGHTATAPFGTMADRTDVSFYGALHVLMSELVNKYLGKTIVFMTPTHRSGEDTPNPTTGKVLKDYVNAIKQVAEYYGIYVLDTYATSGLTTQVSVVQSTYMNDGLHPNIAGHEYLGNKIAPFFKAI